jgi:hypothetical protein
MAESPRSRRRIKRLFARYCRIAVEVNS